MDRLERLTLDSFGHYMNLNEAFHSAIIDLAKSPMLTRTFPTASSATETSVNPGLVASIRTAKRRSLM